MATKDYGVPGESFSPKPRIAVRFGCNLEIKKGDGSIITRRVVVVGFRLPSPSRHLSSRFSRSLRPS